MASLPKVKLDANGLPIMAGVQERITTQDQADYTDLQKSMSLITGPQGYEARRMFAQNPEASAGLITGLAKQGTLASNPILTTLAQIDKMTQDKRKTDSVIASNKLSTDRFNATPIGALWSGIKGLSKGAAVVGNAIVETLSAPARSLVSEWNKIQDQGNAWQWGGAKPGEIAKETIPKIVKELPGQITAFQVLKQQVQTGKVDLGTGFFPNEETGAAAAARKEQMNLAKVAFKQNGQTY